MLLKSVHLSFLIANYKKKCLTLPIGGFKQDPAAELWSSIAYLLFK